MLRNPLTTSYLNCGDSLTLDRWISRLVSSGEEPFGVLPDAFHFGQCCPSGQFLSSARFE